ncbi:hypothetical protein HMPREF0519_0261, partial [Lentilactobacillus hilgardii DSM 20176 = ATCC 8290]
LSVPAGGLDHQQPAQEGLLRLSQDHYRRRTVSGGHVVVVDLGIGDGHLERFMPLLLENARRSLAKEAGCLRFDVCRDAE